MRALIWLGGGPVSSPISERNRAVSSCVPSRDRPGRVHLRKSIARRVQHVHRVGDDEYDRVLFSPRSLERFEDLLEQRHVAVDQVEPALSGLRRRPAVIQIRSGVGAPVIVPGIDLLIRRRRWCRGAGRRLRRPPFARWRQGDGFLRQCRRICNAEAAYRAHASAATEDADFIDTSWNLGRGCWAEVGRCRGAFSPPFSL